jgi:phenylacetate-CoA ligase
VSDALRQKQWTVLRGLLEEALPRSPFQKARLAAAGVAIEDVSSLEDFTRLVPLTLKAELAADQAAHPPYGSNHTEAREWYTRFCQTSGTSSQPMVVWDTALSWEWLLENWRLGYALAGVRPGEVAFFAFSFGPFLGFWTAYEAALGMGLRCIPGGGLGTVARLQALVRHQASVLCCTPTYALHLASVASREGVDLSQSAVRKILVAGEPGGSLPAVRRQLEAAWPEAEVIDHYGMTEVGPVAFAATQAPGSLRVLGERYFAEVLDPQGQPVAEGGTGELVLTPLGRSSWPLFRYRTGDLVNPRWTVQGLFLDGGILGRADDMVIVRGVNLYPGALEEVVRGIPEIQEYRVRVSGGAGLLQVEVEIEAAGGGVARALEAAFERAFSLRIPVREVAHGTLPRFELKARRWARS